MHSRVQFKKTDAKDRQMVEGAISRTLLASIYFSSTFLILK